MLQELGQLLEAVPESASREEYRTAVSVENVLRKETASARRITGNRLITLYGLDPSLTVFRTLRQLWRYDSAGRPLLALLCASAREPLLRATAELVLNAREGQVLTAEQFANSVDLTMPGRFAPSTRAIIARNLSSSWTQSGHLEGFRAKRRSRAVATPASCAYALLLGYLCGVRGQLLLTTFWASLLDLPPAGLSEMAALASRQNLIDYRKLGSTVDVRFPRLLNAEEQEGSGSGAN